MNANERKVLTISGMGCQHCVGKVAQALEAVPGVASASVDLERGRAEVLGAAAIKDLIKAVSDAGYGASAAAGEGA